MVGMLICVLYDIHTTYLEVGKNWRQGKARCKGSLLDEGLGEGCKQGHRESRRDN